MEIDLKGLAGKTGTAVTNHFVGGTGTGLSFGAGTVLGKLALTAPSFVHLRQETEKRLLAQVAVQAKGGAVDACALKIAPKALARPNFETTGPFSGDPIELHAVIGGTQGLIIFLNTFHFDPATGAVEMEIRYRICDDFGVSLDDVTDQGLKGLSHSLKAFWVLQHERKGPKPFIDVLDLTVPFTGSI